MSDFESDLYYAIQDGNVDLLTNLLSTGANANTLFWGTSYIVGSHWTALHICCQKGLYDCAKCLIDAGAKLDVGDGLQQTPLFYCVHWEWWEIIELLIKNGCNVNSTDTNGRTALHCAVSCTDIRPLSMLIESGANLDIRDHMGRTPLWIAASKNGKLDFIKKLLEANADINLADAEEKSSPIQAALAHADKDRGIYVDLFLSWGASVQASTAASPTPLQTLIIQGWSNGPSCSEVELGYLSLFISKGTHIDHVVERNCRPYLKGTALKMAAERGCLPIVQLLLGAGADPLKTDKTNVTPLLIATREGHTDVVKELLQHCGSFEGIGLLLVEKEYRRINIFECALVTNNFDIAKMLVFAGYCLTKEKYLWTNEDVPKQLVLNLDFWCWLREYVSQPMSLLNATKQTIRNSLGKDVHRKISSVDLPRILRSYILEITP